METNIGGYHRVRWARGVLIPSPCVTDSRTLILWSQDPVPSFARFSDIPFPYGINILVATLFIFRERATVITVPMPKHDKTVNAIMDTVYIYDVRELLTPLLEVKRKLIRAGLFPGCDPDCFYCAHLPNGCENLKSGIQKWMSRRIIMFEKLPSIDNLCEVFSNGMKIEDVSVVSNIPLKIPTKAPFKISAAPRVTSVIIANPTPFPYSSDKAVPWSYDAN